MKRSWIQRYTRSQSILGLTLESSRVVIALIRRENGGTRLMQSLVVPLAAESVLADPEAAGRELSARLQEAGIREKRCTVCLPPGWALTAPVELPAVSLEDLRGFLQLQAEREFPLPPSELHMAFSVYELANGKSHATLAAVPAKRVQAIQRMLAVSGRRAASVSLGIDRCMEDSESAGTINFLPNRSHLDLVVCTGGGVAALRSLTGSPLSTDQPDSIDAATLQRELRVTLGRLPEPVRQQIDQARWFGPGAAGDQVWQWLSGPLTQLGIRCLAPAPALSNPPRGTAQDDDSLPSISAAARFLMGQPTLFEFVPSQAGKLEVLLRSINSGPKRRRGVLLAGLILLLAIPFLWRSQQERSLTANWTRMEPRVAMAEVVQSNIRQFRPWFDSSPRSLHILEGLTAAFPEEGTVWSRSVEIKDGERVTCSGFTRSQAALMEVLDQLRARPEVKELQVQQLRGDNPIQFTFVFTWHHGRQK